MQIEQAGPAENMKSYKCHTVMRFLASLTSCKNMAFRSILNAEKGRDEHRKHCTHKKSQDRNCMYALMHIIPHCQAAPYMRVNGIAPMPDNLH